MLPNKHKLAGGFKMPTFYKQTWGDYTVQVRNNSPLRNLMRFYSLGFNTEMLPYFYSTYLRFDIELMRHKKYSDNQLRYEYRLFDSIKKEVIDGIKGDGYIKKISKLTVRNWKSNAIDIGRLSETGQYKLQLTLSNDIKSSPFLDVAEFTIKDKDEFGANMLWVLASAVIGAIVGVIIGSQI